MNLFRKFTPPARQEGRYGEKSDVPQTISASKWNRLHDSLPFPADDMSEPIRMTSKRVNFGNQRFGRPHLS